MLKRCFGVLLVICMLFTMTQPIMVTAADDGTLVVGNGTVTAGDTEKVVPITIEKKGNVGAAALQFDVVFPDALILTEKPVVGTLFADKGLHQAVFTSPYTISLGNDTAAEDTTAEGVLVTLNFKVKAGTAEGKYDITIQSQDNYNANVDSVTFGVTAGSITVGSPTQGEPEQFTVTFDGNGGTPATTTATVKAGETVSKPTADPTRTGYDFTGWFTDKDGKNAFAFTTKIEAATTIYAGWTKVEQPTTATEGLIVGKGSVNAGDADTVIEITIEKKGTTGATALQFDVVFPDALILTAKPDVNKSLFADKGLHQEVFTSPYTISLGNDTATEDITAEGVLVTLKFKVKSGAAEGTYPITIQGQDNYNANVDPVTFPVTSGSITVGSPTQGEPEQFTVTFDVNGGAPAIDPVKVNKDATVSAPTTTPSKSGFTFDGWFTEKDGATKFDFATPITKDTTVYAGWKAEPATPEQFTVTFDVNGGAPAIDPVKVNKGETVSKPADPTRDGYTFTGWFTEKNGSTKFDFATPITKDTTIYAGWEKKPGGDPKPSTGGGCYIATSVYGSYDTPEVWTLRRFRDDVLGQTWYGRLFIKAYYATSPTLVRLFGDAEWFQNFWRDKLDTLVQNLQDDGFESTPYQDKDW